MKLKKIATLGLLLASCLTVTSCSSSLKISDKTNETESNNDSNIKNENTYTITFYLNDDVYETKTVTKGSTLTDIPSVPTVEGYSIVWDVTDFSTITSDYSVHAVLTENTYTITYYLNDEQYQTQNYKYNAEIIAPEVSTEEGYIFSGWKNLPITMTSSDISVYGYTVAKSNQIDISTYASGETITLSNGGTYYITGTNTDVSFNITSSSETDLYLSDVNSTDLTKPFINSTGEGIVNIIISEDTTLSSTSTDEDAVPAIIYSTSVLTLSGTKELTITSSTCGIQTSKCELNIVSGTYTINATGNAIQAKGKNAVTNITGGSLDLTSGEDGIKSKTDINISNATVKITSGQDGLNADNVNITSGTYTINSTNDGIQGDTAVNISGGTFTITTNTGNSGNQSNTTSSDFIFEEEDTTDYETESYYGLYILSSSTYIEITEDNYSTYSSYTTFYNRVSCKGIKSDGEITISGGSITIDSLDDGINSDTIVNISGGSTTITTGCDGVQADEKVLVTSGYLNVTTNASFYSSSNGNYVKSGTNYKKTASDEMGGGSSSKYEMYNSSKGLKSESLISISSGTVIVNASDDALHSSDYIEILGGNLTISSLDDGMHADTTLTIGEENSEDSLINVEVTSSYEGLEAGKVYINSGYITVNASDDGINAAGGSDSSTSNNDSFNGGGSMFGGNSNRPGGGSNGHSSSGSSSGSSSSSSTTYAIYINGGVLTVNADGDGIDSNQNIYVTGGYTIVYGPSDGGNGALDHDGTMEITGGIILALSSSDMLELPESNYLSFSNLSNFSSGNVITIKDSSGNTIIETTTPKSGNAVTYCATGLSGTYTLYVDGTSVSTTTAK